MKVSWIKLESDKKNFRLAENLGFDVFSVKDDEEVDTKIDELISNKYNTIIVSNEVAGFSQKINNEYAKMKNIDIIISRDKDNRIR